MKTITTTGAQWIEFTPRRDILEKTNAACCLSPVWMCWMPWLEDGVDVQGASKKRIIRNRTGRHRMAGLKGL